MTNPSFEWRLFENQILVHRVKISTMWVARIASVVAGLVAAHALAQVPAFAQSAPIEWSSQRTLTIQDFQGVVPSKARQGAISTGALSFLRIEASFTCRGDQLEGSAKAVFVPAQSWWAGAKSQMWERVRDSKSWLSASRRDLEMKQLIEDANEELLKHEQLHFDMAEIAARKIRKRLEEERNACGAAGDDTPLHRFVGEVTRDFREEQARYDQETKHGTFLFAQGRWESRVKAALDAQ